MKTIALLIAISISLCITFPAAAQYKNTPGFYVNGKSDTIHGFFNMKKSAGIKNLKFTNSPEKKNYHTISLDSAKTASFGKSFYTRWFGKRGMNYVTKFNYEIVYPDSFRVENILLKRIYDGKHVSLYHYADETDHYFLEVDNLIRELSISYRPLTQWEKSTFPPGVNLPSYYINPDYQTQILAWLADHLTSKQKQLVSECPYDITEFTRLIKKIDY